MSRALMKLPLPYIHCCLRSVQPSQTRLISSATSTSDSPTSNPPKHPLYSKRCIITGATRGIGRAIALTFASHGASLLLLGRDESTLSETASACTALSPLSSATITIRTGDVGSREFWTSLDLDAAFSSNSDSAGDGKGKGKGTVDVLVNAAGIAHSSLFVRTSPALIEDVIQTNLMGTIWSSQIIGKKMLAKRHGVIINVASLLATHGGAGSAAYVASKAGVLGLTRSLAAELGRGGVRVNAVVPGYVETDMTRAMSPQARDEALSKIPAGRFGTAEEVAEAVVFLATNRYANNCVLNLDGGLSAT